MGFFESFSVIVVIVEVVSVWRVFFFVVRVLWILRKFREFVIFLDIGKEKGLEFFLVLEIKG